MSLSGTSPIRRSLLRLSRRVAGLVGAAALVTATVVAVAAPAGAVDTATPLEGVVGVGDVAAGAGKVFVAALDKVVVADSTGTVTGAITGLSGATGLALNADSSRLYVALGTAPRWRRSTPRRLRSTVGSASLRTPVR